jgi:hypothetical protein
MKPFKTTNVKIHTAFSSIDRCPLFCLDLLDDSGRVIKFTKWARHEQDNVTLALREILESRDVMGPAWHDKQQSVAK